MTDAGHQLATLRKLCPGAELWEENGKPLIFLPELKVVSTGQVYQIDALLCPRERNSYLTRLFFSKQLPVERNWSAFSIKAGTWYAFSWQGVPADTSWLEILAMHLEAAK